MAWLCIEFPSSRQCAPGSELGSPSLKVGQGTHRVEKKKDLVGEGKGTWEQLLSPLCCPCLGGWAEGSQVESTDIFHTNNATFTPQQPHSHLSGCGSEWHLKDSLSITVRCTIRLLFNQTRVDQPCMSLLGGHT